jgi:uncharacterized RDD family membrane protein YckC
MNNFTINTDKNEYKVTNANIPKRLASYLIDYLCSLSLAAFMISIVASDELAEYYRKIYKNNKIETTTEISLVITEDGKQETTVEEKEDKIEDGEIIKKLSNDSKIKFFTFLIIFSYFVIFTLTKQQATPGQRLFNLMTVRMDGGKIVFNDVLNRICLLFIFNILSFVCLFTKNNITIHDYLSKTMVIEIK